MTVKTIISADDGYALAIGVPEYVNGGVIVSNSFFPLPAFLIIDDVTPDGRPHSWKKVGEAWEPVLSVVAAQEMEATRTVKWDAIKAERDKRKAAGVKVGEHWLHSDTDSRVQWLGLKDTAKDLLAVGGTASDAITMFDQPVLWKTLAGDFIPVTVQLALDVVQATKELDAVLFKVAEQHRAAMEASTDPAAYDFSTNWPLVYEA